MDSLFIFSRLPVEDELRLVQTQSAAKVLLLGPAVFTPVANFKNRIVLVLAEEIEELGLTPLPPGFKSETSTVILETMLSHKVFNF